MRRRSWINTAIATVALTSSASHAETGANDVRIIDTHTHFYDPTRSQGVPWPGKGSPLYRPVYPRDWAKVAEPCGVRETVVVEASPWPEDNDWLLALANEEKSIVGVIGNLDPRQAQFEREIKRLARDPLFRGIRVSAQLWSDRSLTWRKQLGVLVDHNLVLEVNGGNLSSPVLEVAREFSKLRIVVDHVASAGDAQGVTKQWTNDVKELGRFETIFCKVSALQEQTQQAARDYGAAPKEMEYYQPILDVCWKAFGPDRLLYGSNWPVCERGGTYESQFRIVREYFSQHGQEALEKYWAKNAKTAYQIVNRAG